jgi:hypothetical protein
LQASAGNAAQVAQLQAELTLLSSLRMLLIRPRSIRPMLTSLLLRLLKLDAKTQASSHRSMQ